MRRLIGKIGGLFPLESGGGLVYRHKGQYEMDVLSRSGSTIRCSTVKLLLPPVSGQEWFEPALPEVAGRAGLIESVLRSLWESDSPVERAAFYFYLTSYFGTFELGENDVVLPIREARRKYKRAFERARKRGEHIRI